MPFDPAGKKVLVTGASSGIGAALARGFAAGGATVGLVARREARLAEVAADCPGSHAWVLDLADPAAVDRLALEAPIALDGIDVLVNNAGIPMRRHVIDLDPAAVEQALTINYLSPTRLTLGLLPHLLERPRAWIVNIASVAATLSSPGEAAYDASKAALTAFSEAMAIDLWDTGISVLVVHPGLVATELIDAPGNEPVVGDIEPIPPSEVVTAVMAALASGANQLYVPAWFQDIAVTKATNPDMFLVGAADYVRQWQSSQSLGATGDDED